MPVVDVLGPLAASSSIRLEGDWQDAIQEGPPGVADNKRKEFEKAIRLKLQAPGGQPSGASFAWDNTFKTHFSKGTIMEATMDTENHSIIPESTAPAVGNQDRKFTDTLGRVWKVNLSLATCKRIDASDFSNVTDKDFSILEPQKDIFMDVLTDTNLLFAITWVIVQPQVKDLLEIDIYEEGISEKDKTARLAQAEERFLEGIDGSTVKAGRDAVWGAVADFFPEHRNALLVLLTQYNKAKERIDQRVAELGDKMEAVLTAEVDQSMDQMMKELDAMASQKPGHGGKSSS